MADILKVCSSGLSHPGHKRANNEDYFTYFEPNDPEILMSRGCLYVVADGVGGAAEGERASQYAAQTVLHEYFQHLEISPEESLKQAIKQASQDIFEYAEEGFRRMATTVVAAVIRGEKLTVANVGDSRAYLIRNGNATQISIDHNTVEEMVQNGLLSEDDAVNFKAKNVLTRAVGSEYDVDVDIFSDIQLRSGDKILLCTDGLTRYATQQNIVDLTAQGQIDEIASKLINFANQQGGKDNTSVIFIEIGKPENLGNFANQPHRTLPPEVDWDSITTQTPSIKRRGINRFDTKLRGNNVSLVIASLSLIAVLFFVGFAIQKFRTPKPANMEVAQATLSVINDVLITTTNTPTTILMNTSIPTTILMNTSTPEIFSSPEIETSTSIPEVNLTEDSNIPTNSVLLQEREWCVYIVSEEGPRTIREIIIEFAGDRDPEELLDQVFEATAGNSWDEIWPNGLDNDLPIEPTQAQVALAFIKTVNECEDHGGVVWLRP